MATRSSKQGKLRRLAKKQEAARREDRRKKVR